VCHPRENGGPRGVDLPVRPGDSKKKKGSDRGGGP